MGEAIRSDGELLAEFAASGREPAFEELVRRHGPLVLGACRRLLGDGPDAEDAAQAVFMVLASKARRLRGEGSLAGWLHRVARHVALRAREAAAVRRAREKEAAVTAERGRSGEDLWAEVRPQLDGALDELPERYRTPLILHHIEGRTQEESAALLGLRTGTLSARLSRGREMLRERLAQRGAVCSAAMLAGFLAERAPATLPGSFLASTVKAAALAVAGKVAAAAAGAGGVSAGAAALTEGVLKAMFWMKVKLIAGVAAALVVTGAGAGVVIHQVSAAESPAGEEKAGEARLDGASLRDVQGLWGGQNVFLAADGSAVVQVVSPSGRAGRGLQEKRYELKLDAAKVREFEELLVKHDFFGLAVKERPGVPDEARPEITVRLSSGRERSVRKWANDKHPGFDPIYRWLLGVAEAAKAGKPVREGDFDWKWRPEAKPPAASGQGLSEEEMKKLAEATARKGMFISMSPVASTNPHLGGETVVPNPLAGCRFWCVLQAHTPAAPRRAYVCVDRSGQVTYPFAADGFGRLLAAEKTGEWKDGSFVEAAQLYVHLTSVAHQDGLKFCKSADDFMAVKFNMFPQNEAKRQEVAKEIAAPKVVRADAKTTVTFYAWHLIGGALKRWTVEFGPEFKAESKDLGRFGGGGYD